MQRWCWFSDAPVRFVFDDSDLYGLVRPLLDELCDEPGPTAKFTCVFETADRLHAPGEASLVHAGHLGAGLTTMGEIFASSSKEWLLVEGTGSVEIDRNARTASIRVMREAASLPASTIALFAVDAALSMMGQQLLHGAGLAVPSGEGAILIFAPSGVGKTTTSLALALGGFRLLTDDALVLRSDRSVWGLPRAMKVHWRTADLLPALQSVLHPQWNDDGEQVLTRSDFSRLGPVNAPAGTPVPVIAVFLLGERTGGGHRLERMSKTEALLALANDNVGTSRLGVLPRQVKKMETIAGLLSWADVAALHVGKRLETLGRELTAFLDARRKPDRLAESA